MVEVYMFSYETMCLDLLDSGIKDSKIEVVADEIISELELSATISIDGTYIVGNVTAYLLREKYQISWQEVKLI
jgi:hypothetical protein